MPNFVLLFTAVLTVSIQLYSAFNNASNSNDKKKREKEKKSRNLTRCRFGSYAQFFEPTTYIQVSKRNRYTILFSFHQHENRIDRIQFIVFIISVFVVVVLSFIAFRVVQCHSCQSLIDTIECTKSKRAKNKKKLNEVKSKHCCLNMTQRQ